MQHIARIFHTIQPQAEEDFGQRIAWISLMGLAQGRRGTEPGSGLRDIGQVWTNSHLIAKYRHGKSSYLTINFASL
jgi:hypothetical protein